MPFGLTNRKYLMPGDLQDKNDSLRFLCEKHREEIHHHEVYISAVLTWTLSIVLALIGSYFALVSTDAWSKHPEWREEIRIGLTVLLLLLPALATRELYLRLQASDENARIVVAASKQLGFFDVSAFGRDEAFYPEEWLSWGNRNKPSTKIVPVFHMLTISLVVGGGLLGIWIIG
jgi:hypothetical protein